ncbi:MAG: hypothetical protein D6702_11635 [Planctomycetota bacterium]|nr:MAG: hypothetical protein D6702_11635 [Planctomycetota bacterium]
MPYPFGDVEGDGYDDLLFYAVASESNGNKYRILGLVDGATFALRWAYYWVWTPMGGLAHPLDQLIPNPHEDLNGDGYLDPIFQIDLTGNYTYEWVAFSGRDGSELWRIHDRDTRGSPWRAWCPVPDLDGDGLNDFFIAHSSTTGVHLGSFRAMSSADGSVIWETFPGLLDPHWNSTTAAYWFLPQALPVGDLDGDGLCDLAVEADDAANGTDRREIWTISGADGSRIGVEQIQTNLAPFYPGDSFDDLPGTFFWPLGDITGDGLGEYARPLLANDFLAQNGISQAYHMAIYSRQTLAAQSSVRLGHGVTYEVFLPAAGNSPFSVAVSTAFLPERGDLWCQDYDLHLGRSAVLAASVGAPALTGRLDAHGRGSVRVFVPARPALIGQRLYAVAGARRAADGRFVRTTFSETEILP